AFAGANRMREFYERAARKSTAPKVSAPDLAALDGLAGFAISAVGKPSLPPYMRRTVTGRQRSARFGSEGEQARRMQSIISISKLCKTYKSGFQALKSIDLEIRPGEIFALLGPNGAGKTTLINIVCGVVKRTSGTVTVAGMDIELHYR